MKCDIIIPVWNQYELTKECVEYIMKNTFYPFNLILIDNGSDSRTRYYLEGMQKNKEKNIKVIRNEKNLGFIKAVNQGLKESRADYVCIMNNDTKPGAGWLSELVSFAQKQPDIGLLNPLCNGHAPRGLTINEYANKVSRENKGRYMEMNQCQGFCMLIKRGLIEKIGYMDERFGIGGFDDTDYSMRAHKAGYRSACLHSSYVFHEEHKSFDNMGKRKKIQAGSEKAYFKKWSRHLRIGMLFSVSLKTKDGEIINFLNTALFLAREWCWVNLLIFGNKNARERIEKIKREIDFPLHQNIKFNFLNLNLRILEIIVRILERAFGTKRRKKYDLLVYDNPKHSPLLSLLCGTQGCQIKGLDFSFFEKKESEETINSLKDSTQDAQYMKPNKGSDAMKCDIILPVCDQYDFTKKCIESIIKNTDTPFRLIVINNGKNPDTKKLLDDLEKDEFLETLIVHNNYNIGWVKALNKGIELSTAPFICFQNDDTIVTRSWLRKMIDILNLDDKFGLINPSWEGRPAAVSIDKYNSILERKSGKKYIETDWCRGFSVVIKRSVVEKIGKVDERYGLAYFDDVDYSVTAIEAGFIALIALDTYVYHHRNVTFFEVLKGPKWNELHEKNKLLYHKKWGRPLRFSVVIDAKAVQKQDILKGIVKSAFYLARKQHRVHIFSPSLKIKDRFLHTNIVFISYPSLIFDPAIKLNFFLNSRKKTVKKWNAVFVFGKERGTLLEKELKGLDFFYGTTESGFDKKICSIADEIKEKTKNFTRND